MGRTLCAPVVGAALRRITGPQLRYLNEVVVPKDPRIGDVMLASIFFGLYERGEARMIRKHLDARYPVIELGASLGIISSLAGRRLAEKRLVCVEALPDMASYLNSILTRNEVADFQVFSGAYASTAETVLFNCGETNLSGTISQNGGDQVIEVKAVSLRALREKTNVYGAYTLISDIEGAEVDLLLNEPQELMDCRRIIIEMHDTTFEGASYKVTDIQSLIEDNGFRLIDKHGRVAYFEKEMKAQ